MNADLAKNLRFLGIGYNVLLQTVTKDLGEIARKKVNFSCHDKDYSAFSGKV